MDRPTASSGSAKAAIDFGKAQLASSAPGALVCAECRVPIGEQYWSLGDNAYCPRCRDQVQAHFARGAGLVGCVRSGVFGFAAAAGGALLWAGVTHVTGYELGIVAIVVGFAVGVAVKLGSGGRGGLPYQLLAVAFTYLAIVSTYVPALLDAWTALPLAELEGGEATLEEAAQGLGGEGEVAPPASLDDGALFAEEDAAFAEEDAAFAEDDAAFAEDDAALAAAGEASWAVDESGRLEVTGGVVVAAFVMAMAVPFMLGFENAIGILIIGFALFEAWRQNRRTKLELAGPFRVGARTASTA